MTSTPPPSSDGTSLPPRHRPNLGDLSKDSTELDLWAFEDDLDLDAGELPSVAPLPKAARTSGSDLPARRKRQGTTVREAEGLPEPRTSAGVERIKMNVSQERYKSQPPAGPLGEAPKPGADIEDLEHWEDATRVSEIGELPAEQLPPTAMAETVETTATGGEEPAAIEQATAGQQPAAAPPDVVEPAAATSNDEDEFSPVLRENAVPFSLRPKWILTKAERVGLLVLLAVLVLGGLAVLAFSIARLPTESARATAHDFPIKGGHITVQSAFNYWRAPLMEGPAPDTARRGTRLLPVLEMEIAGGAGAVRVLFRNEDRVVIGDAVTRAVQGAGTLTVPATAGFDDLGMHAAYRTGESKPWTIEVFEAPSVDTPGKDFKRLFEMNISTDRR
jgi:hypothetical protein